MIMKKLVIAGICGLCLMATFVFTDTKPSAAISHSRIHIKV